MRTLKAVTILFAVLLATATAWAQVDLPFEMYGEKIEIDTSGDTYPGLLADGVSSFSQNQVVSYDGQLLAAAGLDRFYIGAYPDFELSEVFDITNVDYEYDVDLFSRWIAFHPDNVHLVYTIRMYDEARGATTNPDTLYHPETGEIIHITSGWIHGIEAIGMVNTSTGEHEMLVEGGKQPQWSPDGRYMLYKYDDYLRWEMDIIPPDHDEWVVYDSSTRESLFLRDVIGTTSFGVNSGVSSVTFSEDGTAVYFLQKPEGKSGFEQLYRAELDGSSIVQLSDFQYDPTEFAPSSSKLKISPDGEWASFTINFHTSNYLIMYELSSGRIFSLLTGEELSNDLQAYYDYNQHFRDSYIVDGSMSIGYNRQQDNSYSYHINDTYYDFEEFHLMFSTNLGWSTDLENIYLFCSEGPFTGIRKKSFDPMFYKSQPSAVADAAPAAFPTIENYPNPFNPVTTLSFNLPEAGFTELSVYNLAGQKVRELVAADMAPGVHEVVWDGRDMHGMPVSSGVFFSQLKTGDTVVTDRMTLVK